MYLKINLIQPAQKSKEKEGGVGRRTKETEGYGINILYFIHIFIWDVMQIFHCDTCEQFTNFAYEDLLLNNSKFFSNFSIYKYIL